MHFLQNSQRERAEIKNLHSHICIDVISSSGRFALPPAFGELEQRGDEEKNCPSSNWHLLGLPTISYTQASYPDYSTLQEDQNEGIILLN